MAPILVSFGLSGLFFWLSFSGTTSSAHQADSELVMFAIGTVFAIFGVICLIFEVVTHRYEKSREFEDDMSMNPDLLTRQIRQLIREQDADF